MILTLIANFWESSYKKNKFVKLNLLLSVILNISSWALLIWKIAPLATPNGYGVIDLHYNLFLGVDLIGPWYYVFSIAGLGLFVILFNNLVAFWLYKKEKVLSYFLIIFQSIINMILFAATIFVVLLNI